jgi:hypothetical protein
MLTIFAQVNKKAVSVSVGHASYDLNLLGNAFDLSYDYAPDNNFSFQSVLRYGHGWDDKDPKLSVQQYQINILGLYSPFQNNKLLDFRMGIGTGYLYSDRVYLLKKQAGVSYYKEQKYNSIGFIMHMSLSANVYKNTITGLKVEHQTYSKGYNTVSGIYLFIGVKF